MSWCKIAVTINILIIGTPTYRPFPMMKSLRNLKAEKMYKMGEVLIIIFQKY